MVPEIERLSNLVGRIYDAAIDPTLWTGVLKQTYEFVGGGACAIYSKDGLSRTGSVSYNVGISAAFEQSYFDTYVRLDPTTTALMFCDVGDVVGTADLVAISELFDSRFYREWLQPQRIVDSVRAILDKSSTSYGVVSVFRFESNGPADDESRHRMRLITPHFRRAVLIGNVIDLRRKDAGSLTDLISRIEAGVFLVDPQLRLVFSNAAGQAMLDEGILLFGWHGVLTVLDPQADSILRETCAASSAGDAAVGHKGIAVPMRTAGGERWIAHVLPLTSGARRQAHVTHSAVAALFVRKAALDMPSSGELVARLYKLSASEVRVLHAIVHGSSIAATAEALGISEATVKTHVQRLFDKTSTSRQSDLIKLVAAHASPFTGSADKAPGSAPSARKTGL